MFDLARAMELAFKDASKRLNPKSASAGIVPLYSEPYNNRSRIAGIKATPLASGKFSNVFRDDQGVLIAINEEEPCGETTKAMLSDINRLKGEQAFIPVIYSIGYTKLGGEWFTLYRAPLYKVPIQKSDNKQTWLMYQLLENIITEAKIATSSFDNVKWSRDSRNQTIEDLKANRNINIFGVNSSDWKALVDTVIFLIQESMNYSDTWLLEMPIRNVAVDGNGQLILLDIFYDAEAVDKQSDGEC